MKKLFKTLWITLVSIVGAALLAAVGLIVFLSVTEYKPAQQQTAERIVRDEKATPVEGSLTIYSWNLGYGGLGKDSDFFMDGGKMVNPPSQDTVQNNMDAIVRFVQENPADAWLLQEVDICSARTGKMDQFGMLTDTLGGNSAFAYNYKCNFVPFPLPPIGKVESGIATITDHLMQADARRVSLPCPFSWPVRTANLKRCLLITYLPVANSDKTLVLINLHLEAYDDGEGKVAQTALLMQILQEEYEKGNYVIAGGDFNQTFPGALEKYPITDPEKWAPGTLDASMLPEGWQFAYDSTAATCRLLDQPYNQDCQKYVIDGYILSPNIRLDGVETVDLDFANSDHNPVRLNITLLH